MNLEVKPADAGVSQHDVAVGVPTDDQHLVSARPARDLRIRAVPSRFRTGEAPRLRRRRRRRRRRRGLVDDVDVLEDGAVLEDGEHRDPGLVAVDDPRVFAANGHRRRGLGSSTDSALQGRERGVAENGNGNGGCGCVGL